MRLLLALLAVLTGLSLPDVAVAFSRAEVAESGAAAQAAQTVEQRQQRCAARTGTLAQPCRKVRRTIWLPLPALTPVRTVELSDRARE
ncbi:MAG: hypothetical protein ACK4UL_03440 [Novosphingobium meiothermophilum]|uniref:hypothetical protein n=1 Tax=Novosphingobium TaxID=165696 RepID=UPI000D6E4534|nr:MULTISPECIES: hypothetical protein [Novosphingobium]